MTSSPVELREGNVRPICKRPKPGLSYSIYDCMVAIFFAIDAMMPYKRNLSPGNTH